MRADAIGQARARLSRAKAASVAMRSATAFSALDESWADFLVAANLVFLKLGAGAKGCTGSEPWFGRKLHDQKQDDLLSFLRHARGAEEHGLERSVQHAYQVVRTPAQVIDITAAFKPNGDVEFRLTDDPSVVVEFPLTGALSTVRDRAAHLYPPPKTHNGQPFPDQTVFAAALAAIAYLEGLVAEAEGLPVH